MRVSVVALDVLTVELSLAGSTGGIELVDQPFECFHRHIVLIGAKQELACRIRRIGLDIGLCLGDGNDSDGHADADPEDAFEHHSPFSAVSLTVVFAAFFARKD